MNMAVDDSRLADDEYRLAFNVRNRFGDLRPVRTPNSIDIGFSGSFGNRDYGRMQGIYTIGNYILVFHLGNAKIQHRLADTGSLLVDNPNLDLPRSSNKWIDLWDASTNPTMRLNADAKFVYVQAVPGSTMNTHRDATSSSDSVGEVKLDPAKTRWVNTVAGIIVQDGINTPNLITFDTSLDVGAIPTVRKCKLYTEWDASTREYVPVGKQMMFFGGKLYIVSPDGRKIYHSVSGRPLDFVVAINTSGAQIDAAEANGGADVVSYSVSYEPITCIAPLNTDSFFVSTRTASYAVTPDYARLVFGEPTFAKKYLFGASVINQFSFVDILGDFAFVDAEGMRSFNAVTQLRNEGRNSAFSLKVAKLFEGVVQDEHATAAIEFDNYAYFACKTIYGNGILVYDITLQKFVSFDTLAENKYTGFGTTSTQNDAIPGITQFTKIDSGTTHNLYATTTDGRFVKMYSGNNWSKSFVLTRAYSTGDSRLEQKPMQLRVLLTNNHPLEVDWFRFATYTADDPPAAFSTLSPDGVNTDHSDPGTMKTGDPMTIIVALSPYSFTALPHDLPVGTKIRISNVPTMGSGGTGIFTLTEAATWTFAQFKSITGTFTSASQQTAAQPQAATFNEDTMVTKGFLIRDGSGTIKASVLANGRKSEIPGTISKSIIAPTEDAVKYGDKFPIMLGSENKVQNFLYSFQQGRNGWKLSYAIDWDTGAALSMLNIDTQDITPKNSLMTQAYGN
jgi:hypothetical protein